MANDENLKRGRLQPGDVTQANATRAANREQESEIDASEDPDDVTLELFKEASKAALRGYRKLNKKGGEPSRQQLEASKEARQLADVCRDIIRARGAATAAEHFFAEVARRITKANLAEGPQPVGEVARP